MSSKVRQFNRNPSKKGTATFHNVKIEEFRNWKCCPAVKVVNRIVDAVRFVISLLFTVSLTMELAYYGVNGAGAVS